MKDVVHISTSQQYSVTVHIDGQNIGIFDTFSGGDALATEVKHRPGGMGDEESFASLVSYSPATVTRVYKRERDHEKLRNLTPKGGRVGMSVTEQPLDADGNVWGKPNVYSGRFLGVKRGDVDSTSGDPRMLELDMSVTSVT
jgi:hypothetical protein